MAHERVICKFNLIRKLDGIAIRHYSAQLILYTRVYAVSRLFPPWLLDIPLESTHPYSLFAVHSTRDI